MNNNKAIDNRLNKNFRKLKKWLETYNIEAFRLYDRDIPEYPFIIDIVGDFIIIYEKSKVEVDESIAKEKRRSFQEYFNQNFPGKELVYKTRSKNKGSKQYEKANSLQNEYPIKESGMNFLFNPYDYLDYGLFLDHRPLRYDISNLNFKNKKTLNLYAYTCSISVALAHAGSQVTSVDLSKTYLEWGKRNFKLNQFDLKRHDFIQQDCFEYLKQEKMFFDVIIVDPPSFSNSKRMKGTLDIQRDHPPLIHQCMKRLKHDGVLYFSNNLRSFKIDSRLNEEYLIRDVSKKSIPQDFRDLKIHQCYEVRSKR